MDSNPLLKKKKNKICCCFTADDSDEDLSSVSMLRVESEVSPSVLEPEIYASKMFAADKIYLLGGKSQKFIVSFKHFILDSLEEQIKISETLQNLDNVPDTLWKDRYKIFSRFDEGVKMCEKHWLTENFEKIGKSLARIFKDRIRFNYSLVAMSGAGSVAIQLAEKSKVIALDSDEPSLECLKTNSELYKVSKNLTPVKADLLDYNPTEKPDIVVICPKINANRNSAFKIRHFIPNLLQLIEKSFGLSDSLALVFPPTLEPLDFIESLEGSDINPCIEFAMIFENSHLRGICCLLGKVSNFSTQDILNNISSKLGLVYKQKDLLQTVMDHLPLKTILDVLETAEKETQTGSITQKAKNKAKRFFEIVREDHKVPLDSLFILNKGSNAEEIIRILEEMNLCFLEFDSDVLSLEVGGMSYTGKDSVLEYLEEIRTKETPNKNSLMQLIGK
jgi:RNA cap guanine-N2 methyltransferase